MMKQNNQLMLHIHNGNQEGDTAFFRNRYLFNTVLDIMKQRPQKKFLIFFHACSIGAEVYSFVIHYLLQQSNLQFEIEVFATDINRHFLNVAQEGFYPDHILKTMTNEEINYFQFSERRFVTPIDEIKQKIKFLSPVSFLDFKSSKTMDVVFLLNALTYVAEEEQTIAIQRIANYNSFLFCVADVHKRTIKADVQVNGYIPITTNIESIHQAWDENSNQDLLANEDKTNKSKFIKIPDYQYKLCSIFKKKTLIL